VDFGMTAGLRRAAAFLRRPGTLVGLILLALILASILAPVIAPDDPEDLVATKLMAPSGAHLMGTDQLGRDVLSRVLYGGRYTLLSAAVAVLIAAGAGIPLGLIAGYVRAWPAALIMRVMDVMLAFPGLLLALVIVTIVGQGLPSVTVAIGIAFIPIFVRLVYGAVLSARGADYVLAARLIGCSPGRIVVRHILPNISGQIIVVVSSAFGWAILTGTVLNFLGFGVQPPTPEWGADLAASKDWLSQGWWACTFPGLAIAIAILAANYFGDAWAVGSGRRWRRRRSASPALEASTSLVGLAASPEEATP
jgi:ABC-type dipeptide/oligopeptide/nickel transport system permease subunit